MKRDLSKHTLNLREGDWNYLESVYQQQGVATAAIVRALVSRHVDDLRAKEQAIPPQVNIGL